MPSKTIRPDHRSMLQKDPNLRRWFINNAKGSPITAEVYLRRLGSFCLDNNTTPWDYAKLPKRKMEEMAFDYVQDMEAKLNPKSKQRYAPQYIESHVKAINSWAKWNRKKFDLRIKIADLSKRPTLATERIPTTEELKYVLYADSTPLRTRAAIAIMAFSGCRPEVLGNYLGLDGLRIKDFPEMRIEGKQVGFTKMPTLIVVRAELSKNRHWYPTFLLEEGCELVKRFLERRMSYGEVLTADSGIIASSLRDQKKLLNFGTMDETPFVRTPKLTYVIRKAMRICQLPWRPYIFRSYFDTMQILAESKGYISHPYVQAFMGHSDIESVYSLHKAELPTDLLENMREAYARTSELLSTNKPNVSMSEVELMTRKQILEFSGFTEQEIDKLGDLGKYSMQDLKELDRQKESEKLGLNGHSKQKIIPWSELRQHIMDGWELVQRLDDTNEAIVRLPR